MLARLTTAQLEFLAGPAAHRLSARLVELARGPSNEVAGSGLETTEACQSEDQHRAAALRKSKRRLQARLAGCDPSGLAAVLDAPADAKYLGSASGCLASAVYLRQRRNGVLGAIIDLVRQHPELDTAWLVGTARGCLHFDEADHWSDRIPEARKRFEQQLAACGALTAPGFIIAFLNGYFDPRRRRFDLQYRGIAVGAKLSCLRSANRKNSVRPAVMNFALRPISDLSRQISGMLPNRFVELSVMPTGAIIGQQRMREPQHCIYLLWLSQHSLSDFCAATGAFYRNGQLAMSECYAGTAAYQRSSSGQGHVLSGFADGRAAGADTQQASAPGHARRKARHRPRGSKAPSLKSTTSRSVGPNRVLPGM